MLKRMKRNPRINIHRAETRDVEKIFQLETVESQAPWKKEHFLAEIANNLSTFYVSSEPTTNEVTGYIIFWTIESSIEILNILVKSKYRRQGIGSALMMRMIEQAHQNQVEKVFLEVRKSNRPAIQFYLKFKFKKYGERQRYYKSPPEDAIVLIKHFSRNLVDKYGTGYLKKKSRSTASR
jgi:ribosomal-protein-alanine N-acetyltransferase